MGVSTDAILAYGIDLGEEWYDRVPWGNDEDSDNDMEFWLYRQNGLTYDFDTATIEKKRAIWDKQKEFMAAFPVEDVRHCSGDYPMLFLAVRGTVATARRGYPERTSVEDLIVDGNTLRGYRLQLEDWGIEFEDEDMGWHLFSMWW